MDGEDWELRREARRCAFASLSAGSAREKRMFDGLTRFYESLAASAHEAPEKEPDRRVAIRHGRIPHRRKELAPKARKASRA
jgi:hypothetical protein